MSEQIWKNVDNYIEEFFFNGKDIVLEETLISSQVAGLPPHNVSLKAEC